ncbi:hypothetical protein Hdeb2414_s0019g00546911 [Helianthus debilis subsp. tardiflorus]
MDGPPFASSGLRAHEGDCSGRVFGIDCLFKVCLSTFKKSWGGTILILFFSLTTHFNLSPLVRTSLNRTRFDLLADMTRMFCQALNNTISR